MQKYSRYLPSYLDGDNIHRHAEIIEDADNLVYSQMMEVERWAELDRPILVERVATVNVVMYNVHIKCTNFIRSISISGDYTLHEEYLEDEGILETVISFTMPNKSLIDMAEFIVEVVDYEDITYQKGYPENDSIMGDVYDHDTALDNIGLILNLPRKSYIAYPLTDAENSYPPYFGKEVVDNVVQPCSEDDYYYLQRLKQLKEHMHDVNIGAVLLDLMYGYKGIVVMDSTVLDNEQLVDHITDQYPEFEEYIQPGVYVFLIPAENPSNYESITISDKQDFVDKYIPVTRYSVLADTIHTTLSITDTTIHPALIPTSHREELYMQEYLFDVTFEEDGEDERVITPCSLSYQLDNYTPVLVDYDTEDSTGYRDTHLLGPGWHRVQVTYPATLGYESCTEVYMFKQWIDAYHDFIVEYPYSYPYYAPDLTSGDNWVENRASGRLYHQDSTYNFKQFLFNLGMVTRDNMLVVEYDFDGDPVVPYTLGFGVNGQGYAPGHNPERQLNTALYGDHTVSIVLPRGEIYVDGRLVQLDKEVNPSYVYNKVFLKILRPGSNLKILESRVSQFIPYYCSGDGLYLPNDFISWQEYTLRAIIECSNDTPYLRLFVGLNDASGFLLDLPPQLAGRHVITMQVVNNIGYLYFDDEEQGHLYDFDTCKQYSYTPPYPESKVLVREDPVTVFNTACYFHLEEDENVRVVSVGICPTTLRPEIEEHTPVKPVSLSCTPEVDELMTHLIEGYNMHFDISCMDEDTPISLPLTLTLGGEEYSVTECNGTYSTVINDSMVHDGSIYYELHSPQGRYYLDAVDSGYITINPTAKAIFLEYVEFTAGETSTLTARLFDDEGNPLTGSQYKTVFKIGGVSVKQGSSVYYAYPDNDGVVTCEYSVPSNYAGKTKTVQAVVPGTMNRIASNVRNVKVHGQYIPPRDTTLSLSTSLSSNDIISTQLSSTSIPVSVSLVTDESTPAAVSGASVGLYYYDGSSETLLDTVTTDSNGEATATLTGLTTTSNSTIEIRAKYTATTSYNASNDTLSFNILTLTDPMQDYLTLSNWSMGSSATGTLSTPTSSNLSVNTTNNTLTDQNTNYFIYNKTLQDFFDYYGDEFSFIAYKTGGDGRYKLGFVNTTNGNILGYQAGTATNQEASSSCSQSEVVYQKYNQITFKKIGTDIHVYWKKSGTTYVDCTLAMGSIDPTAYKFFFKSDVRSGLTLTTDASKIDHYSRDPGT